MGAMLDQVVGASTRAKLDEIAEVVARAKDANDPMSDATAIEVIAALLGVAEPARADVHATYQKPLG